MSGDSPSFDVRQVNPRDAIPSVDDPEDADTSAEASDDDVIE